MTVSSSQRLKLIRTLSALPKGQFEELCFALNPPPGVVPDATGDQSSRAGALLKWVEGPGGCGWPEFLDTLAELAPGVIDPSEFNPPEPASAARIFISYKRDVDQDETLAKTLQDALGSQHQVFIDQDMPVGTRWVIGRAHV